MNGQSFPFQSFPVNTFPMKATISLSKFYLSKFLTCSICQTFSLSKFCVIRYAVAKHWGSVCVMSSFLHIQQLALFSYIWNIYSLHICSHSHNQLLTSEQQFLGGMFQTPYRVGIAQVSIHY